MVNYLGGLSIAGGHLKQAGTSIWTTPNTGADNSSSMTALPAGIRTAESGFIYSNLYSGTYTEFFTSTQVDLNNNYYLVVSFNSAACNFGSISYRRAFSIRLIKDSTSLSDGQTSTMIDNNGNTVNTICIGTQEWTSENCKQTKYNDGTDIPFAGINGINFSNAEWSALTTPGVCSYDNDDNYV
jgi:hypothetical protein